MRSERILAMRKLSMHVDVLCCRDSSTRIRIWFSPETGSTISNAAHEAKRTNRLRRQAAAFGQPWKERALRVNPILASRRGDTQNGSCAAGQQPSKLNPAMD